MLSYTIYKKGDDVYLSLFRFAFPLDDVLCQNLWLNALYHISDAGASKLVNWKMLFCSFYNRLFNDLCLFNELCYADLELNVLMIWILS